MWLGVLPTLSGAQPDGGVLQAAEQSPRTSPLERLPDERRVERVLSSLSTRDRAAQILLAYPQVDKSGPVRVGGVLFLGTMLRNTTKAKERIEGVVSRARVPPFIAVDMEGGRSNRLSSVKELKEMPSAKEMAALDDARVFSWGATVGKNMRALGLNVNLAPVLDVAPSGHMERNGRSFSGEAKVVEAKAQAFARGLLSAGVIPIGKHFPGYGDIDSDSDHHLVVSDWSKARVLAEAEVFFRSRSVLGGVMLANVGYSAFGARPAILTEELISLVHDHGWLAVTDDIAIRVLADAIHGTSEDVLREALMAGNDLILTTAPPDWALGIDPIGVLTEFAERDAEANRRLEAACRRVLRLKDQMGLLEPR
jgi:beta-N-acetylhexosaminidase